MIRSDFIKSTALFGAGLVVGLPGIVYGKPVSRSTIATSPTDKSRGFTYPRGGCTESGLALFDRGPRGGDPFRFNY